MVAVIPLMAFYYAKSKLKDQNPSSSHNETHKPKIDFIKIFPMFVLGFILFALIRSLGDFGIIESNLAFGFIDGGTWNAIIKTIQTWAGYLFVFALGGVGLTTNFGKFRGLGKKPFLIGLFAALTTGLISFSLISLFLL
jgi:uncharacterized membrane protein YadS